MSLMSIEDEERVGLAMNLVDMKDGGMKVAMRIGLHARGKGNEVNLMRFRWCGRGGDPVQWI